MSEEVAASSERQSSTQVDNDCGTGEEEALDPRVGPQLERLNAAAEAVNKYENELTQGKIEINKRMHEIVTQMKELAETIGTSRIEQARDYYDTFTQNELVKQQLCEASAAYKLAVSRCEVAKEMLRIAEQGFLERTASSSSAAHLDFTYQEMLNHATETVVRAETERSDCDQKVRELTSRTAELEIRLNLLRRQHPRSIERTAVYFEYRERIDMELKQRRRRCEEIAAKLRRAKSDYRRALRRLDEISNEIHQRRSGAVIPPADVQRVDEEEDEEEPLPVETQQTQSVFSVLHRRNGSNSTNSRDLDNFERERKTSITSKSSISLSFADQLRRPSIIETAMQSARNLVESATRTRKSVLIAVQNSTSASNSANVNVNEETTSNSDVGLGQIQSQSQAQPQPQLLPQSPLSELSMSIVEKNDEFPIERGTSVSTEPDAFRSEIERARWRRMGDANARHAESPIRARSNLSDTADSQSESSSVASFLLDVAYEKLALSDVNEKPTPPSDSLSSVSRTSAATADTQPSSECTETDQNSISAKATRWSHCDSVCTPRHSTSDAALVTGENDEPRRNSADANGRHLKGTRSQCESDGEAIETKL